MMVVVVDSSNVGNYDGESLMVMIVIFIMLMILMVIIIVIG
jgi:hypothetical protein